MQGDKVVNNKSVIPAVADKNPEWLPDMGRRLTVSRAKFFNAIEFLTQMCWRYA
jgi:hypothetical protein